MSQVATAPAKEDLVEKALGGEPALGLGLSTKRFNEPSLGLGRADPDERPTEAYTELGDEGTYADPSTEEAKPITSHPSLADDDLGEFAPKRRSGAGLQLALIGVLLLTALGLATIPVVYVLYLVLVPQIEVAPVGPTLGDVIAAPKPPSGLVIEDNNTPPVGTDGTEAPAPAPAPVAPPPVAPAPVAPGPAPENPAPVVAAPAPGPVPGPVPPGEPAPAPKPTSTVKSLIDQGWKSVESNPGKAQGLFGQAVDREPNNADANLGLGYSLIKLGRPSEAGSHLCKAKSGGDVSIQREAQQFLDRNGLSCGG